MNEEKNAVEAVAGAQSQTAENETSVLPLSLLQAEIPDAAEINAAYLEEISQYKTSPVSSCSKATSLKLLKRFTRKSFPEFWTAPVLEYLPAVSEGTMKLCECVYPHDEAIRYAKNLISTLSVADLAKDFLYGVAHNAPEYRTALAGYYYIKNLPEHEFEKRYLGSPIEKNGEREDKYDEHRCEICGYDCSVSSEPKMQFWHINNDMAAFYLLGYIGRSSLNMAISFLEEYKKLPRPKHSRADYEHFKKIIEVIEKTPETMTSGKLRQELKQSGLLQMTIGEIEMFIDTLGYLDILHPDDSHGMLYKHTLEKDMLCALKERGHAQHPVNRWTRKSGIDYKSISLLFDGIYDEK